MLWDKQKKRRAVAVKLDDLAKSLPPAQQAVIAEAVSMLFTKRATVLADQLQEMLECGLEYNLVHRTGSFDGYHFTYGVIHERPERANWPPLVPIGVYEALLPLVRLQNQLELDRMNAEPQTAPIKADNAAIPELDRMWVGVLVNPKLRRAYYKFSGSGLDQLKERWLLLMKQYPTEIQEYIDRGVVLSDTDAQFARMHHEDTAQQTAEGTTDDS